VNWDEPPVVPEPHVPERLRRLPNVVLAPHNGGATEEARAIQVGNQARNIVAHIRGEYVPPSITPEDVTRAAGA
jgi:phosphoglycerate dehydrogenase-like enzyme